MATGRRLLGGAGWTYGAQLTVVVMQFAYAAVTSRMLGSSAFGAYAVALSVTSLITLLSTGGLGQTAGRMRDLSPQRTQALATYAALLGLVGCSLTVGTAGLWAAMWGSPLSEPVIQLFSVSALLAPGLGLVQGLCQRLGRFRQLAGVTLISNLVSMTVGVIVVMQWRSPASLAVFPICAQLVTLLTSWWLVRPYLRKFDSMKYATEELSFSWRLIVASVMSYAVGNITRIGTSRVLGVATLGQWNRAEVVSSVPFQQIQSALIASTYPEFRHDIENPTRAKRVWPDLLSLVAWFSLPIGAVAAVLTPAAIPVIFGPGWETAAGIAPLLCIAGALQIVSTLLASAVEALGKFTWVWTTQGALIVLQTLLLLSMLVVPVLWIPIAGLILTNIARHILHIAFCSRAGYVSARVLFRSYATIIVSSAIAAGTTELILFMVYQGFASNPIWYSGPILIVLVGGTAIYLLRDRLPPVILARRYGLIR